MGGFSVDEAAVAGLGGLVHASGEDLGAVVTRTGMDSGTTGGLFGLLEPAQPVYEKLCEISIADTDKAAALAETSGDELSEQALYYLAKDRESAAAFDRTLDAGQPPERVEEGTVRGDDKQFTKLDRDPVATAQANYERDPSMQHPESTAFQERWGLQVVELISEVTGKASFTGELRGFLTYLMGGTDVIEELLGLLGPGGWELLDAQAVAFQQGSAAIAGIRQNIDQGRFEIQGLWTGNAADSAQRWLAQFSGCLGQHEVFLRQAGYEIMNFCYAMYLNLQQLVSLVDMLIEQAASVLPIAGAADISAAIANLLKDHNVLHFIAAIVSTLENVSEWLWMAQEAVMMFGSAANRLAVDMPVDAATWPTAPHRMPEGMR